MPLASVKFCGNGVRRSLAACEDGIYAYQDELRPSSFLLTESTTFFSQYCKQTLGKVRISNPMHLVLA